MQEVLVRVLKKIALVSTIKECDMNKSVEWGVVPKFEIEADTFDALQASCVIILTEHSSISHWRFTEKSLELLWTEDENSHPLPFRITEPSDLAVVISKWLKNSAAYEDEPDTDGSSKKGYTISNKTNNWRVGCIVKAEWIIYGK